MLGIVLFGMVFAWAFWNVGKSIISSHRAKYNTIQLSALETGIIPETLAEQHAREKNSSENATSSPPPIPSMNWQDAEIVHKAAGLLLRHNDYDNAITLLKHAGDDQEAVLAIGRSGYEMAVRKRRQSVERELKDIRQFWANLEEKQKETHFAREDQAGRKSFDNLLKAPMARVTLGHITTYIPNDMLFCLTANVYVELGKEPGVTDALNLMLLDALLPVDSLNRQLFPKFEKKKRYAYDDARKVFDRCFNKEVLVPVIRNFLHDMKERIRVSNPELLSWYKDVLGIEFCNALADLELSGATELDMRLLWRHVPEQIRALWSRHLVAKIGQSNAFRLSLHSYSQNYWLREVETPIDEETIRFFCSHPLWLKEMMYFGYKNVLQRLPAILHQLGASDVLELSLNTLKGSLIEEQGLFSSTDFDWLALRRHLDVDETKPAAFYWKGLRARSGRHKAQQKNWHDVPVAGFHEGLLFLVTETESTKQKEFYIRLARLFAANRGLQSSRKKTR